MKTLTGVLILLVLFLGSSCTKENPEVFVPYPNDTVWHMQPVSFIHPLDTLFITADDSKTLTYNIDTSRDDTLHFDNHIDVYCPNGFCTTANGGAVSGPVNVSITYLANKGDFIRYAKPTYSNEDGLLVNSAVFRLNLSQNNQRLTIANGKYVNVKFRITEPVFYPGMRPLISDTTIANIGNFNWSLAVDNDRLGPYEQPDYPQGVINGYNLKCIKPGWTGCGRKADNSTSATRLVVVLPVNFTNSNSSVYAVLKDQRSVIRLMPEITSRTFASNKIPAGSQLKLVVLSKTANSLHADTLSLTAPATGWQVVKLKPSRTTRDQIIDLLTAL